MDFRSLILIAQQNTQTNPQNTSGKRKQEEKGIGYPSKFEPPKKQSKQIPEKKKISANVQRFLQSQEQKEKQQSQAIKSNGGKQQQVVSSDAADDFESREASQIYERLLNKFESVEAKTPAIAKSVSSSKSSGKSSSSKKEPSKPSSGTVKEVSTKPSEKSKTTEVAPKDNKPTKPVKAAPPALDFKALLQLAEQNKAGANSSSGAPSKGGPTRLLTEKEKRKLAEEKEKRKPINTQHSSSIPSRPSKDSSKLQKSSSKHPNIPKDQSKSNHSTDISTAAHKPSTRPPPPPNYFTKMASSKPVQPPPPPIKQRRHVIDDISSDEYDSEMDDFIDDDTPTEDYSSHIKEIFGYDKSRYRHIDDADDNMVSSFAQQMREEQISRKIGLMEDLEDMRAEEAAEAAKRKRRKEMLVKQRK